MPCSLMRISEHSLLDQKRPVSGVLICFVAFDFLGSCKFLIVGIEIRLFWSAPDKALSQTSSYSNHSTNSIAVKFQRKSLSLVFNLQIVDEKVCLRCNRPKLQQLVVNLHILSLFFFSAIRVARFGSSRASALGSNWMETTCLENQQRIHRTSVSARHLLTSPQNQIHQSGESQECKQSRWCWCCLPSSCIRRAQRPS